ncbi:TetR/AcrR family transcriptional regulator [Thermomonospora catenispora]|uniref:TetR/AcrR family transcriptional regulator n=1 Tax=Thermomonospora catenispora TaxID=2493090 RepID=UPI001120DADF|nr:TetR/AcrR family transcriptional regulator [Thermomonospora catenispora]TNY38872.1 TetR/AcrR family transcriptional regulator [Thermomonospora catenispora]
MRLERTPDRPKRDREATRRRLLEAARDLFAEHGYDHVPVRAIAARAEANVALVNRYFGSKAALFGEVLASESALRRIFGGPGEPPPRPQELPRRLAEHVAHQIHGAPAIPLLRILDRSVGNPEIQPIIRRHMEQSLIEPLAELLEGPDARLRATAAAAILMGSGSVRRTLGLSELREADPQALTDRLTAMFTAALAP